MDITKICEKYQISPATLYGWKQLFLRHKKLWLGILEDLYQNPLLFLASILESDTSKKLQQFFKQNGHSLLQGGKLRRTYLIQIDTEVILSACNSLSLS